MNYKAILFDMDGTILDTLKDLNAAVNRTLAEFGFSPQTLDQTRRRVGNGSRRLMELSVPPGTDEGMVERMLSWYLPYYNAHANDSTAPYPGITSLLKTLGKAGYSLAVVSNKPDRTVKELSEIHFPDLLDIAVGENVAGHAPCGGGRAWRRAGGVPVCGRFRGGCAYRFASGDGLCFRAVGLSQPLRA